MSAPTLTKNGLLLQTDPDPAGSGMRMRTISDPQSNELVKQDIIPPKTNLRTKAKQRYRRTY